MASVHSYATKKSTRCYVSYPDPECDCTGCIGRHIECRLTDPWSDTAEPEGEPADVGED